MKNEIVISEELLSEVLGVKVEDSKIIRSHLHYWRDGMQQSYVVNVYEFMHMMKEWAYQKGFVFTIECLDMSNFYAYIYSLDDNFREVYSNHILMEEVNIIFELCDWILKELKYKK